ncbi:MAG TPA: chlorite dismutase family protein [Thermoanaerobaculia bacterium]|nr:chlorite dismutase family protein [Thermoanaerobaculia bacterium]
MSQPTPELDLRERSRTRDGATLALDRRLFMQLLAFGGADDLGPLREALEAAGVCGVLYEDVNDATGVALLTISEQPEYFVDALRPLLRREPFSALTPKPELTMFGRTYSMGYEPDLEETLLERPRGKALDRAHRWAIWYPLRRSGSFEQLSGDEQQEIMIEHGRIGMAFGRAGYATDIRLACHGLDKQDSDFVIGLVGAELFPLSKVVQAMRGTRQTALHLERLGPFFVGRVAWQSAT